MLNRTFTRSEPVLEEEYDPNDPGVDMSGYLAEFNEHDPDHDRWMPNADAFPF